MTRPLVVSGLHKRFGRLPVLRGVDLALDPERITALVGPNASGKSTVIKCVLGLARHDAGSVEVLGETVGSDPHYRRFIGYMPQLPRFPDNLSGREVLDLLAGLRRGAEVQPDETLPDLLGLSDDTLMKPVRTLSGGTRQKLNALVAFRHDVPILFLDEPTASLDPLTSGHLKDLIRRRCEGGAAVLLTSHVMAEVEELADVLVYLVEGRVRFHGSLDELRLKTGELRVERAIAQLMREAA
jgi:Cu-processing system ATP-binding protein